ncbi:MAG: 2-dehydropantoate 2-reductase [Proteobacteria bacterium]|nr:2-dehydropantoate 2-reductase [Pseudomonadota bacterium]
MAEIAIVGVGAIGGVMASAFLSRPGHCLTLCARQAFNRLIVTAAWRGAPAIRQHQVRVFTDPDADLAGARPVRWVILATKAHQTEGAAAWLDRLCRPETTVAVVQNGVEHVERVAPLIGQARVLPAIVDCPATRTGPGHVTYDRPATLTLPDSQDGRAFSALLEDAGIASQVVADFVTAAWQKLCVNTISGSIPALCDQPRGVFRRPAIAELARQLIDECIAVGRAEGAELDDAIAETVIESMQTGPPDALTSMLVDRRAGRLLEADARNGAVARIGARHGIATPLNRAVATILCAINT